MIWYDSCRWNNFSNNSCNVFVFFFCLFVRSHFFSYAVHLFLFARAFLLWECDDNEDYFCHGMKCEKQMEQKNRFHRITINVNVDWKFISTRICNISTHSFIRFISVQRKNAKCWINNDVPKVKCLQLPLSKFLNYRRIISWKLWINVDLSEAIRLLAFVFCRGPSTVHDSRLILCINYGIVYRLC